MPNMDGIEATRQIRADTALADIPVIAMTANVSIADRERSFAAGMNDFIGKPFKPHDLYIVLANWLSVSPAPHALPVAPPEGITLADGLDIIDLSFLAEMMNGDTKKIQEFARRFVESSRADMEQIKKALETGDMDTLTEMGHRAKSPANLVGARRFANLCQVLENSARSGNLEQARDIVYQLVFLLQQISQIIEAL